MGQEECGIVNNKCIIYDQNDINVSNINAEGCANNHSSTIIQGTVFGKNEERNRGK